MKDFFRNLNKTTAANFIAFSFVYLGFATMLSVLFGHVRTDTATTTQVIATVQNILPFIAGYYFGKQQSVKEKNKPDIE